MTFPPRACQGLRPGVPRAPSLAAALLCLTATALYAGTAVAVGGLASSLSGFSLSTIRFALALCLSLAFLLASGKGLRFRRPGRLAVSGLLGALAMTLWSSLIGIVICSPFALPDLARALPSLGAGKLFLALAMGVAAFSANYLSFLAYRLATATVVSVFLNAELPLTLVLSWVFLGEGQTPRALVGGLLILSGCVAALEPWTLLKARPAAPTVSGR